MDWEHPFCMPVPELSFQPSPLYAYFNASRRRGYNPDYEEPGDPVGHKGIDLNGPHGSPIVSAHPGEVGWAGWGNDGSGNVVAVIEADDGGWWMTRHLHLSTWTVRVGDTVKAGDQIGTVGISAKPIVNSPHDHFEIRWLTQPFNPDIDTVRQGTPLDPVAFGILERDCTEAPDDSWPDLLKVGDRHIKTRTLNAMLMILGYRTRAGRTKRYGWWSGNLVAEMQGDLGVTVDKIVGPDTRRVMYEAVAETETS